MGCSTRGTAGVMIGAAMGALTHDTFSAEAK
jgi:hypothetical protein